MTNIYTAEPKLPTQYVRCKLLWFHVLWQALQDLAEKGDARKNAFRWINSDSRHIGSFLWLCDTLDIDPWQLRLACGNKDLLKLAKSRLAAYNKSKTAKHESAVEIQ